MIKRFIINNKCLFPSVVSSETADLMKYFFNLLHMSNSVHPWTHRLYIAQARAQSPWNADSTLAQQSSNPYTKCKMYALNGCACLLGCLDFYFLMHKKMILSSTDRACSKMSITEILDFLADRSSLLKRSELY